MKSYTKSQSRRAAPSGRAGRGVAASALRLMAATTVTTMLTLALLPPTDAVAVRHLLADAAPSAAAQA